MARQPRLIVGTAGHVDHGKTELIKRLTGINTDRWREEQERGLTIDLGFAYLDLPDGERVGIVDVPGHERFVRNMLAGVCGIDLVLLTVAADEGVMPQTREHIAILDMLGVRNGIVVITKADRADEELIEMVQEEVSEALAGTTLAGSPIVVTSAVTGQGLDVLVAALQEEARRVEPHDIEGPARMPIDRSFTIAGHGTVATGSLIRGTLEEGQEVEVIPAGVRGRVRRLEVHGEIMPRVAAPARVGVNLGDIHREEIGRGDQLVEPGSMRTSWRLDAEVRLVADARAPLRHGAVVRLHIAAGETNARVILLDGRKALEPGQSCFAQLRLDRPVAAASGDRFVIRSGSPITTIGGGTVLDPWPRRHGVGRADVLRALEQIRSGGQVSRAVALVRQRARGVTADELGREMQVTAGTAAELLRKAQEGGKVEVVGERWIAAEQAEQLRKRVLEAVGQYHRERPLHPGMALRDVQSAARLAPEVAQDVVAALVERGELVAEGGRVRLTSHTARPTAEQKRKMDRAVEEAMRARFRPLSREQVLELLGGGQASHDMLAYLLEADELVQTGELIWARSAVEEAAQLLRNRFGDAPFTVADARDVLGSTRKYVLPLLEYFDRSGVTTRRGDERRMRSQM